MKILYPFLLALQFMTRMPVPKSIAPDWDEKTAGEARAYYPLVGLIIGLCLYLLYYLLQYVVHDTLLTSAIIVVAWIVITGALHIDGLADTVDAWVGGIGNQDRTLEIMKDPNAGPMAVVAIFCVLALKLTALAVLIRFNPLFIIFVPMLARIPVLFYFKSLSYLRESGLGKPLSDQQANILSYVIITACLLVFIVYFKLPGLYLVLLLVVANLVLGWIIKQRFNGITGDLAGFTIEMNELFCLLFFIVLAG